MASTFKKYCADYEISTISRYHCIYSLEKAIADKRGKYTAKDCEKWLYIMGCCLMDDSAFEKLIRKGEVADESGIHSLLDIYSVQQDFHKYIIPLITACRDRLKKLDFNLQADQDWKKLQGELNRFVARESKQDDSDFGDVFHPYLLKSPVFRSFLPFYLWVYTAQTNGLFFPKKEENTKNTITPFTRIEISEDKTSFSIRKWSIKKRFTKKDIEQLWSLYNKAHHFVAETLQELSLHSMGQHLRRIIEQENPEDNMLECFSDYSKSNEELFFHILPDGFLCITDMATIFSLDKQKQKSIQNKYRCLSVCEDINTIQKKLEKYSNRISELTWQKKQFCLKDILYDCIRLSQLGNYVGDFPSNKDEFRNILEELICFQRSATKLRQGKKRMYGDSVNDTFPCFSRCSTQQLWFSYIKEILSAFPSKKLYDPN